MGKSVLFDIDGTLLHADGVGREAFHQALSSSYGERIKPDLLQRLSFVGATDLGVLGKLAEESGIEMRAHLNELFFLLLSKGLDEALSRQPPLCYPGVVDLLEKLTHEGYTLGIASGNSRATAWSKLRHAGIDVFFTFGAYGDEFARRESIFRAAKARSASARIVVGDAPQDVKAGHAADLKVLSVGTGWVEEKVLLEAGADRLFHDLSDTEEVFRQIELWSRGN